MPDSLNPPVVRPWGPAKGETRGSPQALSAVLTSSPGSARGLSAPLPIRLRLRASWQSCRPRLGALSPHFP